MQFDTVCNATSMAISVLVFVVSQNLISWNLWDVKNGVHAPPDQLKQIIPCLKKPHKASESGGLKSTFTTPPGCRKYRNHLYTEISLSNVSLSLQFNTVFTIWKLITFLTIIRNMFCFAAAAV